MRKVIDHVAYDTKRSSLICEKDYGEPLTDDYACRALYMTRRHKYFFYEYGAPYSRWGIKVRDVRFPSKKIKPVTDEDADKFMKVCHLTQNQIH